MPHSSQRQNTKRARKAQRMRELKAIHDALLREAYETNSLELAVLRELAKSPNRGVAAEARRKLERVNHVAAATVPIVEYRKHHANPYGQYSTRAKR